MEQLARLMATRYWDSSHSPIENGRDIFIEEAWPGFIADLNAIFDLVEKPSADMLKAGTSALQQFDVKTGESYPFPDAGLARLMVESAWEIMIKTMRKAQQ